MLALASGIPLVLLGAVYLGSATGFFWAYSQSEDDRKLYMGMAMIFEVAGLMAVSLGILFALSA